MHELKSWRDVPAFTREPFLAINAANDTKEKASKNRSLRAENKTGDWPIPKAAMEAGLNGVLVVLFFRHKGEPAEVLTGRVLSYRKLRQTGRGQNRYRLTIKQKWEPQGTYAGVYHHFFQDVKLGSGTACAWVSNQETPSAEAKYQQAVLQKATTESGKHFKEPIGGVKLPPPKKTGLTGGYQRNPAVAAAALSKAHFKCEIDPNHKTFVSRSKGKPYVEAHHLVPLSSQADFMVSLDVTANVVALCPTCHRLLHHGKEVDKEVELNLLFGNRKLLLLEKQIRLTKRELLKNYHGDILED